MNRQIIKVPADAIRGAQYFTATKDKRGYLKAIYVSKEHVCASDGYAAFIAEHHSFVEKEASIMFDAAIPKQATIVKITIYEDDNVIIECIKDNAVFKTIGGSACAVDNYPNIQKLFKSTEENSQISTGRIMINPDYLVKAKKALGLTTSLEITNYGDRVVCKNMNDHKILILKCRYQG